MEQEQAKECAAEARRPKGMLRNGARKTEKGKVEMSAGKLCKES